MLLSALLFLDVASGEHESHSVELPSSCLGQDDGYTWLKPLAGADYPIISQKCSNEHMIIDVSYDPNVKEYLSSWDTWHYAIGGPSLMDHPNWEEWYLPNAQFLETPLAEDDFEHYSYILSPQCNSCSLSHNTEHYLAYSNSDDSPNTDRTAYYMTGTLFGCLYMHKAMKDCRWDYDSYTCAYCTKLQTDGDLDYSVVAADGEFMQEYKKQNPDFGKAELGEVQISLCGVYPRAANTHEVPQNRNACNSYLFNIKPSIGTEGENCQCVKPNRAAQASTNRVSAHALEAAQRALAEFQKPDVEEETGPNTVELTQADFMTGTYRITRSGVYVLQEDIVFDFNAGDLNEPNAEWAWWPNPSQADVYKGAGEARDEYFLGFFAGITVEADDVVIDLNGHQIEQSLAFYYQQRFFSCIALKSAVFPLNQGPGIFGTSPVFPNDVVIKDGSIGLSSHFGIHGHENTGVRIENVHIHSFETHGIEMSYFHDLEMFNVEIGPSSSVAFLKGEYGYGRWLLQRLEKMLDDPEDYIVGPDDNVFPVLFDGRTKAIESLDEMADNLRDLMDIAFKAVMKVEEYDETDERYQEAKALFINDDGLPYGAVMYGLFLNLYVSNVFAIHPTLKHGDGAVIENLYIHDLHHKMDEYVRFDKLNTFVYKNPFDAALDASAMLGDQLISNAANEMDWTSVRYRGSVLTDVAIILDMVTPDWGLMGFSRVSDELWRWAKGEARWTAEKGGHPYLGCNNDRMTHVAKGVMGIRMDGTENVHFKNLMISDLVEHSELGSDVCGEYWDEDFHGFSGKGHFLQNAPYLYGYTGNMAHGLFVDWATFSFSGDVSIHGISSKTGLVRAVGLYVNASLDLAGADHLDIYDLKAGMDLYDMDTSTLTHPNSKATAKAFHLVDYAFDAVDGLKEWDSDILNEDDTSVSVACMLGRDGVQNDWDGWDLTTMDTKKEVCPGIPGEELAVESVYGMPASRLANPSTYSEWWWAAVAFAIASMGCVLCLVGERYSGHLKSLVDEANGAGYGSF